jgi:hypothetical protein
MILIYDDSVMQHPVDIPWVKESDFISIFRAMVEHDILASEVVSLIEIYKEAVDEFEKE